MHDNFFNVNGTHGATNLYCLISIKSVISKFKYNLKPITNHVIQPHSFPNLNNLRLCFWGGNFSDLMEAAKKRKLFSLIFYISLIIAIAVFALFSYSIVSSILNGPKGSAYPKPTMVPQPSIPQMLLEFFTRFLI